MQDTSDASRTRYFELLRRLSPAEKLRAVNRLNAGVRRLALAGLRKQHPAASSAELRRLLAVRLYGEQAARFFSGAQS